MPDPTHRLHTGCMGCPIPHFWNKRYQWRNHREAQAEGWEGWEESEALGVRTAGPPTRSWLSSRQLNKSMSTNDNRAYSPTTNLVAPRLPFFCDQPRLVV